MQSRYVKSVIVTGILNNPKVSKTFLFPLSLCPVFTENHDLSIKLIITNMKGNV